MKIQTNKTELTLADLQEVLTAHDEDVSHKQKLKRYFVGKHDDILRKSRQTDDAPNNRLISNFPAYITNMSVGFFIGQPVSYKSASENEKEIRHFSYDSSLKFISAEKHYFVDVPVVEYANNKQHRGDFEDVLSLVDAYNKAQSLTLDDLEDFTDCFLILKGMGGTNKDDVKELRQNKVITLDDGGAAEWLVKNVNDTYVENVKTRLQTDIHKFSSIPDMSDDNFAGNASGVAIKYKLIGLEQIRSRKEREFKKSLQRRIELISGILKLKNQPQIDFRNIEIVFTANIPANIQEQAQVVSQLDGFVSQKTLLSLLPFVTDPLEEISELQHEKDAEFSSADKNNFPNLTEEHNHDEQQGILGEPTT